MVKTKYLGLLIKFSLVALCLYIVLYNYIYRARYIINKDAIREVFKISKNSDKSKKNKQIAINKTILLWTPPNCLDCTPFPAFKHSNLIFQKHDCEFQNCYINSSILNPEDYDAVVFNGRPILRMGPNDFPRKRRKEQIYIFLQLEAATRFPVCDCYFDDFFNWTLTYRLNSDIPWTYFEVKTIDNVFVGPSENAKWINGDNESIKLTEALKTQLCKKNKLAAWFVSNCVFGNSQRLNFVKKLNRKLVRINTTLSVDIYGACGPLKCPKGDSNKCNELIEKHYLFYLAMENSFDEDYITEKVLRALQYNALPVVYGAANYSRFLPPGSYLDALELGPEKLAKEMYRLSVNREEYSKYFQWKRSYSFVDNFSFAGVACKLCERLNTNEETSRYLEFRKWWKQDFAKYCEDAKGVKVHNKVSLKKCH